MCDTVIVDKHISYHTRSRSPTPSEKSRSRSRSRSRSEDEERIIESEERRVVYVGNLYPNTTERELKKRFRRFGKITKVNVHKKRHYWYGFVTFRSREDAYQAKEHGNDDGKLLGVDLSFGGRRIFCKDTYSDLDDVRKYFHYDYNPPAISDGVPFDCLLDDYKQYRRKQSPP